MGNIVDEVIRTPLPMTLLKDDAELLAETLPVEAMVYPPPRSPELVIAAAAVFNRSGSLLARLSKDAGIDIACPLAVWLVQSGGRAFLPRRAFLRFEVQEFFPRWGNWNRNEFDRHFKFGGHNLQSGPSYENHEFRSEPTARFTSVHHNQNSEYATLTMARMLAGDAPALCCASVGGPLLPLLHYELLGYESAVDMFDACQESERAHILGFFDYCRVKPGPRAGDLMKHMKALDWSLFAKHYTEEDRSPIDPERLAEAQAAAAKLLSARH
jgi:N-acetylmuramidase